jgi:hypothetical protein
LIRRPSATQERPDNAAPRQSSDQWSRENDGTENRACAGRTVPPRNQSTDQWACEARNRRTDSIQDHREATSFNFLKFYNDLGGRLIKNELAVARFDELGRDDASRFKLRIVTLAAADLLLGSVSANEKREQESPVENAASMIRESRYLRHCGLWAGRLRRHLNLDNVVLDGIDDQVADRMQTEFAHNIAAMGFDSLGAQTKE